MKLTSFRVTNYRCINDSGEVQVHPKVTCLVGKNESGKTGLLEALRRSNPLHPATFDKVQDFPRSRLRAYERNLKRGEAPVDVVVAKFALDDEEVDTVSGIFGTGILKRPVLTLTTGYDTRVAVPHLEIDESKLVAHLLGDTSWAERASAFSTLGDLQGDLAAATDDPEAKTVAAMAKSFSGKPLAELVWERVLKVRCPRFMYFADYSLMSGSSPIALLSDPAQLQKNEGLRTLKELLDLAGTTPQELLSDANYEHHKAGLEATANDITREVFNYWRQNPDLEVEFDVHRSQAQGDAAKATFYVRIKNRRHGVTVPFDERSRGFVWFFSFLVAFNSVVDDGAPFIILLDEPGLNLHGKAQADLLRFIEERLAPQPQVIYTTHSPFMVDPQHLDRVRTVEDRQGEGTVVGADYLSLDADTLFPLQAALGYDVAQSLFVGPNCLLVEGPSDLLYLQAISRISAARGGSALDERWVITPVGGADKLAAFVALMGANKLNLAVLMDVAKNGRQRVENLVAKNLLDASRVIQVSQFVEAGDADIEDLLDRALYLKVVQEVLGADLPELPQGPRIVKCIEKALGRRFDHYSMAVRVIERLDEEADDAMLKRFGELFGVVNALVV